MDLKTLCGWAGEEVKMILQVLPDDLKDAAARCTVSYEEKPSEEDGIEDDVLGLFEGASMLDEPGPEALPRIRIFVGNIWDYAEREEQDFRDEVGTTFLHELGHYFGWDEEEIADRGLE
jgi:predicted Zn-dependent protease with MMP-like domain